MGQRNNSKGATKSGTSDNGINFRVPGKRAHSKTDKYDMDPSSNLNLGINGQVGAMGGQIGVLSPMD
jgi:hypothetical protein